MGPRVGRKHLQAVGKVALEFRLQRIIGRTRQVRNNVRGVARLKIQVAEEIGVVGEQCQQIVAVSGYVAHGQCLIPAQTLLQSNIPLGRVWQAQVWIERQYALLIRRRQTHRGQSQLRGRKRERSARVIVLTAKPR